MVDPFSPSPAPRLRLLLAAAVGFRPRGLRGLRRWEEALPRALPMRCLRRVRPPPLRAPFLPGSCSSARPSRASRLARSASSGCARQVPARRSEDETRTERQAHPPSCSPQSWGLRPSRPVLGRCGAPLLCGGRWRGCCLRSCRQPHEGKGAVPRLQVQEVTDGRVLHHRRVV